MFSLFKQKQTKQITKAIFSIQGMHCVSCSLNIEGELEDTPGIFSANANYAHATCTVEYDPKVMDATAIVAIVKKIGYDLTPQEV